MKSVAILVALFFGFGVANAENVDWSQYLETKSDKPLVRTSGSPKVAKASPKKVAKAKVKPKKRTAARAKKRR